MEVPIPVGNCGIDPDRVPGIREGIQTAKRNPLRDEMGTESGREPPFVSFLEAELASN
jgi:hypothetical protein